MAKPSTPAVLTIAVSARALFHMEDGNAIQIADASMRAGFNNLRRSGLKKVMEGVTSLQEINRVTSE